ncbi:MAG: fibronectin type III domain-containing protein [Bacteroidales bacterium]|nr:fibronectin type III domain-containing protein [Bacteroidales bacterium]
MKKSYIFLAAAAVVSAVSCQKSEIDQNGPANTVHMEISAIDTKTVLGSDGQSTLWNASGEKLMILESAGGSVVYAESADGVTPDGGHTMNFGVDLPEKEAASYTYYALYPSTCYVTGSNLAVSNVKVITPSTQHPTNASFDPAADFLVSSPVTATSQPTSLELSFARKIALGKMTISNLNTSDDVASVRFEAEGKKLSGRSYVDLTTGRINEYGYASQHQDYVELDYAGKSYAANGLDAYFMCFPETLSEGDAFKVTVSTKTKRFVKNITVQAGKSLEFKAGEKAIFTIDFTGIEGEVIAVDKRYGSLKASEITVSYSYTNAADYVQTSGLKWKIGATKNNDNMQLGNANGSGNSSQSYIKLPDLTEDIRIVKVHLKQSMQSGKHLALVSGPQANPVASDAIITQSSTATEIVFDLENAGITGKKTAYLRADAVANVTEIEFWAGEDNRPKIATPSDITAVVDDEFDNKINISWTAVDGALKYVVTVTDPDDNSTEYETSNTTYSVSNLEYSTTYQVTVATISADKSTYLDSDPSAAVSVSLAAPVGPTAGSLLFSCDFGTAAVTDWSSYNGGTSYGNASTITYTASSTNIKIDTGSAGNMEGGNLFFNEKKGSANQTLTIAGIKTYGATSVTVMWAANNASSAVRVAESTTAQQASTNSADNEKEFVLTGNETTISLVFTNTEKANTRIDNVRVYYK